MRKLATAVGALVLALVLVACTPEEQTVYDQVNAFRRAHGLPELVWEERLYPKVTGWSAHMADAQHLSHSTLTDGVPPDWRTLGENVAVASSPTEAATLLEQSPAHRANLLNPAFTKVAVGIVERDGAYWVTQVFMG